MDFEKQQYLQSFLHIVRGAKSKNQFLKNVQQFDNKFTEVYQGPSFQNKPSYESFQSVQQIEQPQKPKNPFISQNQQNVKRSYSPTTRPNNFMPQQQPPYYNGNNNFLSNNQNKMNIAPSRTQQDFFKQQQGSKTFHGGFNPRQYQRPNYNQQFTQPPAKGPNFAWQTSEGFTQPGQYISSPPPNYYQQQMKQNYNEMRKNFANFNMNDQPKHNNYNHNDLSINSHHNLTPLNSGLDSHPNQFLAAFIKEDDGMGKYYKAPIPYPPKQDVQNTRNYMDKRTNPFANQ